MAFACMQYTCQSTAMYPPFCLAAVTNRRGEEEEKHFLNNYTWPHPQKKDCGDNKSKRTFSAWLTCSTPG